MQRPQLVLGVGLLLSLSLPLSPLSLYLSCSPSSEIFLSLSLPLPLCLCLTLSLHSSPSSAASNRFYSYRTPWKQRTACEKCKSQAKSGEKNRLGFFWPRDSSRSPAYPLARSLSSAPLGPRASEGERPLTGTTRPLHRNRIRDAFVTYRGRVQVNAIRPIDFYLPPHSPSPSSSSTPLPLTSPLL